PRGPEVAGRGVPAAAHQGFCEARGDATPTPTRGTLGEFPAHLPGEVDGSRGLPPLPLPDRGHGRHPELRGPGVRLPPGDHHPRGEGAPGGADPPR
ncbi:hypothetical protein ABTM84_18850, partial [Acinetobacter baumannii]